MKMNRLLLAVVLVILAVAVACPLVSFCAVQMPEGASRPGASADAKAATTGAPLVSVKPNENKKATASDKAVPQPEVGTDTGERELTIQLLRPKPGGVTGLDEPEVVRENATLDGLTIREMVTHLMTVREDVPPPGDVHLLFDMLPYSVRYEIVNGVVWCPYLQIVHLIKVWTPIDGTKTYDERGRLVLKPTRSFVLADERPGSPKVFAEKWTAALPQIAKDIAYMRAWYAQRKNSLQGGWVYEKRLHMSGFVEPGKPEVVERKIEYVHRRMVFFDPSLDRCDPKKYYADDKNPTAKPSESAPKGKAGAPAPGYSGDTLLIIR